MTESAAVQLRALRAAIASGQVGPFAGVESMFESAAVYLPLIRTLHPGQDVLSCRCHDRDHVLAGLDRLIAEIEAQEAQHASE